MKQALTLLLLIAAACLASSEAQAERTKMRRNLSFIVRNPDRIKNIAHRFHVPPKELVSLNKPIRKRQMVYAGKQLVIPVWLKRKKIGDKNRKEASDFSIADYELDTDSVDAYVREDFVNVSEIERDTVRRITIDKEVLKIDRKLVVLRTRMDSLRKAADALLPTGIDKENANAVVLKKMEIAREQRGTKIALEAEIDSLTKARIALGEEKSKINGRVEEYEYLVENAAYNQAHAVDENKVINLREWGDDPNKTATEPEKKKR
jgi:hypothetical protein